ncbi:MAG: hypothetical protein EXS10_06770 [Phycisphaerales bacterium]|nr:hypothetical protein [Phycisphaerales bacterium]
MFVVALFIVSNFSLAISVASSPPETTPALAAEPGVGAAIQLTSPEQFVKAGENYFSPNGKQIVFQAIEQPAEGAIAEEFYSMYVADLVFDAKQVPTGITAIKRVSPVGSANTCGWFHPTKPNTLIFASTMTPPIAEEAPGYQRGSSRYRWSFPKDMRIVEVDLAKADGSVASLRPIEGDGKAYVAEGSVSPDGRFLLFCSLELGDGDIYVRDLKTGVKTSLVHARGYDGGPFFSPNGKQIVYRSDRNGDSLLQVYVADLVFTDDGSITGTTHERQLTANEHVNWCPFFRPDGETIVFGSSEVGHSNYEVFEIILPKVAGEAATRRRVTNAAGADILPAFSPDGKWLLWTGQRNPTKTSQLYLAPYIAPSAK